MKLIVGKKYRCTQPLDLYDHGITGRDATENCKNRIVTVIRTSGVGVRVAENSWWINIKWLEPTTKIIKYNKEIL